jgi:hypothetical protein
MTSELIIKLIDEGVTLPNWSKVGSASALVRQVRALFPSAPVGDPTRSLIVAQIEYTNAAALEGFVDKLRSLKDVEYAHTPGRRDLLSSGGR